MYLGIDIGGTKTLVACLDDDGNIQDSQKFPTPQGYTEFLKEFAITVANLSTNTFTAASVAIPGRVDYEQGIGLAFGNLSWKDIPIKRDLERILNCPVAVENDANLAGLSEAMLMPQYNTVLYITISTGIGTGIITSQAVDPNFAKSEGGHILLEHKGKLMDWEDFASGSAIVKRFGKRAGEITDEKTWKIITKDLALGIFDLLSVLQPEAVVLGGGVSAHFDRFEKFLLDDLKKFETPLTPIPPLYKAQRPEEAVVYGCFYHAKNVYGSTR